MWTWPADVSYLLDTDVVSELRKSVPDRHVAEWYQSERGVDIYLSTLVVGEIRQGIERLRPREPARAGSLDGWLAGLVRSYRERILPITVDIAQEWGRLNASPQRPPVVDGLLAATARVHQLVLVTRNVADVAHTGVAVVNPFDPP